MQFIQMCKLVDKQASPENSSKELLEFFYRQRMNCF